MTSVVPFHFCRRRSARDLRGWGKHAGQAVEARLIDKCAAANAAPKTAAPVVASLVLLDVTASEARAAAVHTKLAKPAHVVN